MAKILGEHSVFCILEVTEKAMQTNAQTSMKIQSLSDNQKRNPLTHVKITGAKGKQISGPCERMRNGN